MVWSLSVLRASLVNKISGGEPPEPPTGGPLPVPPRPWAARGTHFAARDCLKRVFRKCLERTFYLPAWIFP